MKKLLMLATCLTVISTAPAFAKNYKPVISPEELFQLAKDRCPKMTNWQQAKEIRACIAAEKEKIIWERDALVRSTCGKYEGEDRVNCVDWVYLEGNSWSPSLHAERVKMRRNLQKGYKLPDDDPAITDAGKRHIETEKRMIERAKKNDPRSRQSTITGVDRNPTPSLPSNPHGTVKISPPPGRSPGGISLKGTTTSTPGQLNVEDDVKKLAH
jgi:hypothetical protein